MCVNVCECVSVCACVRIFMCLCGRVLRAISIQGVETRRKGKRGRGSGGKQGNGTEKGTRRRQGAVETPATGQRQTQQHIE